MTGCFYQENLNPLWMAGFGQCYDEAWDDEPMSTCPANRVVWLEEVRTRPKALHFPLLQYVNITSRGGTPSPAAAWMATNIATVTRRMGTTSPPSLHRRSIWATAARWCASRLARIQPSASYAVVRLSFSVQMRALTEECDQGQTLGLCLNVDKDKVPYITL